MKTLLLSALLLAALPAFTQEDEGEGRNFKPVTPKAVVPANGRITGTVLCGDTRKPARGAMLIINAVPKLNLDGTVSYAEGSRENMTRVGLDGTYSADRLPPGEYAVTAMFPGYLSSFDNMMASQMEDNSPAAQRAMLIKQGTVILRGAESETFNLTLERGAAVSGRILYSDGSPAAQVSIDLESVDTKAAPGGKSQDSMNIGRMMKGMFTQQSNSTDDQGHYRIAGIAPGTYRVAAVQSFGASALGGGEAGGFGAMFGAMADTSALRFYSGDTTHRKAAKTYELRPNDEVTGIDFIIPEHAFHHVSGRLVGAAGKTPTISTVTLTDTADETIVYTAVISYARFGNQASQADPRFDFPSVPSGTYTLAVKEAQFVPPFEYKPGPNGKSATPPVPTLFAPASTSVLVKDADVPDLSLTVTELPPDTNPPHNKQPGCPRSRF